MIQNSSAEPACAALYLATYRLVHTEPVTGILILPPLNGSGWVAKAPLSRLVTNWMVTSGARPSILSTRHSVSASDVDHDSVWGFPRMRRLLANDQAPPPARPLSQGDPMPVGSEAELRNPATAAERATAAVPAVCRDGAPVLEVVHRVVHDGGP